MLTNLLLGYAAFALTVNFSVQVTYIFTLLYSAFDVRKMRHSLRFAPTASLVGSQNAPAISILVPAYNEELTILETIRSLLGLEYPSYEVIVINDGSKDDTLATVVREFDLKHHANAVFRYQLKSSQLRGVYHNAKIPRLFLLDKENRGKADTLNLGINFAHYPLICSIDADSLLERKALGMVAKVFMEDPEHVIAVGGNICIANGCTIKNGQVVRVALPRKPLPMLQAIEYTKAFLAGRVAWGGMNMLLIISGAFGVFRKDYMIEVGGYREGFPGEDMNVVIKLHKYMLERKQKYRIAFCPEAVCWTQAPDSFRILASQRRRWGRGNINNMLTYIPSMLFRPRYKSIGMFFLPFQLVAGTFDPYLKLTGILALIAYMAFNMWNFNIYIVVLMVSWVTEFMSTIAAQLIQQLAFDRFPSVIDLLRVIWYSFLMTLWYYRLNDYWRVLGHIDFFRNNSTWGEMVRKSWTENDKTATSKRGVAG